MVISVPLSILVLGAVLSFLTIWQCYGFRPVKSHNKPKISDLNHVYTDRATINNIEMNRVIVEKPNKF